MDKEMNKSHVATIKSCISALQGLLKSEAAEVGEPQMKDSYESKAKQMIKEKKG